MIEARYMTAARDAVSIRLGEGDALGGVAGPGEIAIRVPAPGNREYDALTDRVKAGTLSIAAYVAPAPTVPDGPTLSDWRVALIQMGRLDDVRARVTAARDAGSIEGAIAFERFEYANNVFRAELLQLAPVFAFTEAEIDESLMRAAAIGESARSVATPPA